MKTIAKTFFLSVLLVSIFSCQKEEISNEAPQEVIHTEDLILSSIQPTENSTTPEITSKATQFLFPNRPIRIGNYEMVLQGDGNFVCYNLGKGNGQRTHPVWATATQGKPVAKIAFQSDGNIVAYNSDSSINYWNSGTTSVAFFGGGINFQADGNLVVFVIDGNSNRRVIFSALTDMPQIFPQNF